MLQQEGSLCAQHCLNALLQNHYFTAVDLAHIAQQLDERERQHMMEGGIHSHEYQNFLEVELILPKNKQNLSSIYVAFSKFSFHSYSFQIDLNSKPFQQLQPQSLPLNITVLDYLLICTVPKMINKNQLAVPFRDWN